MIVLILQEGDLTTMPTARATAGADGATPADDERVALRRELRPSGPVQLSLRTRRTGRATVIAAGGELDVLTASKLGAEIDTVIRHHRGDVVLDLRSIAFVDSAGLHLLLTSQRRLQRRSRELSVLCDFGPVRQMIARARLLGALGVESSPDGSRQRSRPSAA